VTLLAIDFVDGQYGWAVGVDATVVATRDGGATWVAQVAPTTAGYPGMHAYTDVSFLDRDRGWAISMYALFETFDGGRHWSVAYNDQLWPSVFRGVQFVDRMHGWIAGNDSDIGSEMVLRTVDGGRTWTRHRTGGEYIVFVDAMNGWSVGGRGIYVTHDGGVNWRGQARPSSPDTLRPSAISFSDTSHGYVVGSHSYRTDDGGTTWIRYYPPVSSATGVTAVNASHVRVTNDGNTVLTSDDGGRTWTVRRVAATTDQILNEVHFVDPLHGWVVGDGGVIRRTDDAGITWTDQVSGTTEPLYDVTFTDLQHGSAVGGADEPGNQHHGVILTTSDGGGTWITRTAATPAPPPFRSVSFVDDAHGWIVGDDGLQVTSDGGQTWVVQGDFRLSQGVQFLDLQHGYLAQGGRVHVTSDSGITWTPSVPATPLLASGSMQFTDISNGWVAGGQSVSRTVDGGQTWTTQKLDFGTSTDADQRIMDVDFQSPTMGWLVTDRATALRTRDGGQTWQQVPTSVGEPWQGERETHNRARLLGLSFADATHGWAVGTQGKIARFANQDEVEIGVGTPSTPVAGQPVELTVRVTARDVRGIRAGTPTGLVELARAGVPIGTIALSNGTARLTSAPVSSGGQMFTARYLGDVQFAPSPTVGQWLYVPRPALGWGFNGLGGLGTGTATGSASPVAAAIPTPEKVVDASGGLFHSLSVMDNGILYASGWNGYGQLGLGDARDRLAPSRVPNIAVVRQASAGAYHSLAVTADGQAWAWGYNGFGALGTPPGTNGSSVTAVVGLADVAAVAAGALHSLALKADGTVWSWGWNGVGQLGDGTLTTRAAPVQVPGLSAVVAIAAGSHHSLAVKADGTVWSWGWNVLGQLGDGTTVDRQVPTRVPGLSARSVSAGVYHSLAIRTDATVAAWGWNGVGQLGDGTRSDRRSPVTATGVDGATAVVAGGYHSLALGGSGSVHAWGWNAFGQLGDGTNADRSPAVRVPGVAGQGVVAGGYVHSLTM
jgi:alpha-tubulin suppressor-like RCC1 family protein/photosystem II stability/assembly factor-like uncharacterized protein